jgi:hypothetical protein
MTNTICASNIYHNVTYIQQVKFYKKLDKSLVHYTLRKFKIAKTRIN